jgi:hypothetical protein
MVRGTSPPNRSTTACIDSTTARALLRKKPVDRMYGSISVGVLAANAAGVGNRLNSAGVTLLTPTSVLCAERMVAMRSSCGFV